MRRIAVALLVLLLLIPALCLAHSPIFLSNGERVGVRERDAITDPERSWAVYGRLAPGETADIIPIVAQKGQQLYLQILVPQQKGLRNFHPRVVLVGPGLPPIEVALSSQLPVRPASGLGARMLPEPSEPTSYYEEFTQMNLWIYGTLEGQFPETGTYRVIICDPAGKGGSYVLAIGKREQFGLLDLLSFPLIWVRTRVWLWK